MSTNDNIVDALTRHQIFVLRYAKGREIEAQEHIDRMIDGVVARMPKNITDYSRARYQALVADLLQYMQAMGVEYNERLTQQLIDFANDEADFNVELLGREVDVQTTLPAPQQIASGIYSSVLDLEPTKGYTIADVLAEFSEKKANADRRLYPRRLYVRPDNARNHQADHR